jgi:hypothetical protein
MRILSRAEFFREASGIQIIPSVCVSITALCKLLYAKYLLTPGRARTCNPMMRSGVADLEKAEGKCPCGDALPEPLPYW